MVRVHILRQELGSILVGAGTIIADDPKLTVKSSAVPDPRSLNKVVVDGKGRIPIGSRFLRTGGRSIIATTTECDMDHIENLRRIAVEEGFDIEVLFFKSGMGIVKLEDLLLKLGESGIESILVEGGSSIIRQFVEKDLYDRFTIYYGPIVVGGRGPSIIDEIRETLGFKVINAGPLGEGILVELRGGSRSQTSNRVLSP
jgi:riboflavin-specific deaminase-like protein